MISTFLNLPWDVIAEVVGASGILSFLLVPLKKPVKKWFKHNEQVMITLVGVGGLLIAGAGYLLSIPTENPGIIAVRGFVVAFASQPFYYFVVKPLIRIAPKVWAALRSNDEEVKSALQPVAENKEETTPVVEAVPITPVADSDVHAFDN